LSTFLLAETAPAPTHWTNWLILGIVAWVVPVLALIAMRVLFLPNKPRPSRPLLTLGALFVAALLRAVLYNVTEAALGVADSETPWQRLSGGTVTITITFALLAVLVAARFEYRDEVKRLSDDKARLQELEAGLASEVARARSEVHAEAQRVLAPIFDDLKVSLGSIHNADTASHVSEQMRDTVDAVVRPLSIQIAERPIPGSRNLDEGARGRHPRVRPEQRLGLGYFFLPLTFALFIISMTAASALFVAGWIEGIRTLEVMFIAMMAMLWLGRVLTLRLTFSPALGGLVFTVIHLGIAYAVTQLLVLIGTSIPMTLFAGWLVLVAAVATLSYRYQLVEHARRLTVSSLVDVNVQLEILLSSLRQQSKIDARRVANILHGPVQTALYASAMRISQSQALDEPTIGRIMNDLDDAMSKLLEGEAETPEIGVFVEEIRRVWGAKIQIDLDVDSATLSVLRDNPTARSCAIEVVREGVNNAIKHGDATHIKIEVFRVEPMLVDITVSNNAPLRDTDVAPGFGSLVLDDLTHDWSLTSHEQDTTLWASVALDNIG
jgi:signal transduction histidine kinase